MKLHRPKTYWRLLHKTVMGPPLPEPEVMKTLSRVHGKLFVDIGANIGQYSLALAKNFEQVYAFEPNPPMAEKLHELSPKTRIVSVFQVALSNTDGETMFYTNPFAGTTGSANTILKEFLYKPKVDPKIRPPDQVFTGQAGIQVKMAKYDSMIQSVADLVKIDVEGAEFMVLEGMKEALDRGRVSRICVELHNRDREDELELVLNAYNTQWLDNSHIYGELP